MTQKNKEQQFTQAYQQYFGAIFSYCYSRVFDKEKSKDLAQEAYCRMWKYLLENKEIKNIKAFLYRVVTNIMIDYSRKRKNVSLDQLLEKGFAPGIDPRPATEAYFVNKDIIDVVESLDKKYADVIILKYVNDLSTKEISKLLGQPQDNIYVMRSRGLLKAKEILSVQYGY